MIRVTNLLHKVFKENPREHFSRIWSSSFWYLKGLYLFFFQVSTSNHSHTFWTGWFKLLISRYQVYWFKSSRGYWSRELEVHIVADYHKRYLWDSELSSVTLVRFATIRVILTANLYLIVNLFTLRLIRSNPHRFFLWNDLFHWFLRSSYCVSFIFLHLHDFDNCVLT